MRNVYKNGEVIVTNLAEEQGKDILVEVFDKESNIWSALYLNAYRCKVTFLGFSDKPLNEELIAKASPNNFNEIFEALQQYGIWSQEQVRFRQYTNGKLSCTEFVVCVGPFKDTALASGGDHETNLVALHKYKVKKFGEVSEYKDGECRIIEVNRDTSSKVYTADIEIPTANGHKIKFRHNFNTESYGEYVITDLVVL